MKPSAFISLALLFAGSAVAAGAQSSTQPAPTKPPQTIAQKSTADSRDSVTVADVQRAADDLARAVDQVVRKVTESPELKVAALKLATSTVNAAQVVVAQQAATLQATLDQLAREVAAITAQQTKPKTH